jgi:hypothetical protein
MIEPRMPMLPMSGTISGTTIPVKTELFLTTMNQSPRVRILLNPLPGISIV